MAEKKKQKPAAFAQEKKTFTGEIPKKANEGKGKNPQHISREMQIPLLDTMSRGRKIQEVSESRCFWTECPKVRGSRSRREV